MPAPLDWILAPLVLGTALNAAEPAPDTPTTGTAPTATATPLQRSARSSPYDEEGARHIAEARGFYGVGRLTIDSAGVWHGTAIQFGRITTFEIDPRGNFSTTATRLP
ncbi:MAG: hypothetical protein SFV19_02830 [Rhodospirillaceae bacterium]|nr:hypothetical protein [Rhodospirillaceae bacterium]